MASTEETKSKTETAFLEQQSKRFFPSKYIELYNILVSWNDLRVIRIELETLTT